MKDLQYDAVVIGGGAAGMAAALELEGAGFSTALVEREDHLGGILMQCIHNGFGLHEFKEELTGPEFAERFMEKVLKSKISVYLNTTVTDVNTLPAGKEIFCASPDYGVLRISSRALVLAMGCRERNRGNVRIPGSRPAGVYTAGLAQRLVNIEGYIPGREIVIIGSGDIGLIMARRMSWVGCRVKAVVEIMPYPSGLTRNIVQCLHDFNIPLYLSSQTTAIFGNDRVEGVEISPMENGALVPEKRFRIDCDTVLLSVGLVPENELSKEAGVELSSTTGGPLVDAALMTNVEGIFACGNVLHVHDLVDWVAEEARAAGRHAAEWLKGSRMGSQFRIKPGANVRYVNPGKLNPHGENKIYLRSLIVKNDAVLELRLDNQIIKSIKHSHVQPSEMINVRLGPKDLENIRYSTESVLEFSIN
ncbi:MAG: NAD(P)/FAD-dependent oxidoreductase [Treponema sp.]|jgi:NADPH-dependent 2,4-dienoyl-CoA reductase/sulfur reductase-like enzyme|nr:NAD(P)/FAD-dependent oxidoreductase [Treponema sp.]